MSALQMRIGAVVGGLVVAAIGFLVTTRVLDMVMEVPAGPGGGTMPLTLPRTLAVTLLALVVGLAAAIGLERSARKPQQTWLFFGFIGLLLSMVPTAVLVDDIGAKGMLAIMHLAVGTVVIPLIAATLPDHRKA